MTDCENKVYQTFLTDLDNIASNFIKFFCLKYNAEEHNLASPLIRWLDFRLRYIDPKPRTVLLSNAFPKELSRENTKALVRLIRMIQNGEDINPYQGKGLYLFHDTSGKKKQNRTDLLWAECGIIHLHLTNKPLL